jgi:nucleotide-binding universal stress UspA family protein
MLPQRRIPRRRAQLGDTLPPAPAEAGKEACVGAERAREARPKQACPPAIPAVRRVLVATDLSEFADRAVPWAYALAGSGGAVVLLHVIEPVTTPNPLYAHYTPGHAPTAEQRAAQQAAIRERLRALAPAGAAEQGVATEVEVVEGAGVAECVQRAAERLRVDAICIASHGRSGLARTLLGSVSQEILSGARLPTFVVPAPRE